MELAIAYASTAVIGVAVEQFEVLTQRLEVFSRQLSEFADTIPAVDTYTQRHSDLSFYDKGALQTVITSHGDVRDALHASYRRLRDLFDASGEAVAMAGRYYATTDHEAAATFDNGFAQTYIRSGAATYVYGMRTDPLSTLAEPPQVPDDAMHGNFDLAAVLSYLSLTNDLNVLIAELTDVDLLAHVSQLLLGDWEAFARLAGALGNAARFAEATAFSLADDLSPLRDGWKGAAAEAALAYFATLHHAIDHHATLLDELSRKYLGISVAVNLATQQLNGVIGAMIDKAVVMVVAFAAGTATAETGVGAAAGWGVAAWQLIGFLDLWTQASRLIQTTVVLITGLVPTVIAIAQAIALNTDTAPLPASAYQHPAIGARP